MLEKTWNYYRSHEIAWNLEKLPLSYWYFPFLPTRIIFLNLLFKSTTNLRKKICFPHEFILYSVCLIFVECLQFLRLKFQRIAAQQTQVHLRLSWGSDRRVHTEWQWTLSGVNFIMMVKSAQPGEGGGCTALPLSFYLPSRAKLWCKLQLRGQIHSPYFFSTPICTLWFWAFLILFKYWTGWPDQSSYFLPYFEYLTQ